MSSSPAYIDESDDDELYRRRRYSSNGKYTPSKVKKTPLAQLDGCSGDHFQHISHPPRYHNSQIVQEVSTNSGGQLERPPPDAAVQAALK